MSGQRGSGARRLSALSGAAHSAAGRISRRWRPIHFIVCPSARRMQHFRASVCDNAPARRAERSPQRVLKTIGIILRGACVGSAWRAWGVFADGDALVKKGSSPCGDGSLNACGASCDQSCAALFRFSSFPHCPPSYGSDICAIRPERTASDTYHAIPVAPRQTRFLLRLDRRSRKASYDTRLLG